jgi:hypothetical protein
VVLSWEPLQPRSYPHQVLRAVCGDREYWLYPPPSGQHQRWRLLEFYGNSYLGASEHPSRQDAQRAAECLQSVDRAQ